MSTETRENQVYMAKVSEQAERFEDMVEYMKAVASSGVELTVEERNMLSVAYKNVIGARRASWRIVNSIAQRAESKGDITEQTEQLVAYRTKIETELNTICHEILDLLNNQLIANSTDNEAKVFYYKMAGDYHRYVAEYANRHRDDSAKLALSSYEKAMEISNQELRPTHPIRLGLALNFSVFYYEILDRHSDACSLAKTAFDEAIAELDSLNEDSYKDSTLIMQLLRDNLTLWTAETENTES